MQAANPEEKLKPGASARVVIIAETIQNTIVVPTAALLNADDGGQKVMVIADSKARERRVSVGFRQGKRVQIVSGLQEGEQVVVSGGLGLEDKAKVTIVQPSGTTPGAGPRTTGPETASRHPRSGPT